MNFSDVELPDPDIARRRLRSYFLERAAATGNHDLRVVADAIRDDGSEDKLIFGTAAAMFVAGDQGERLLARPDVQTVADSYRREKGDPIEWLAKFVSHLARTA